MEENHHHILMNNFLWETASSDEIKSIAMQFLKEEPDNLDVYAWFASHRGGLMIPKF